MIKIGWIEKLLQCRCARMLNTLYALGCVRIAKNEVRVKRIWSDLEDRSQFLWLKILAVASQSCVIESGLLPVSDHRSTALAQNK